MNKMWLIDKLGRPSPSVPVQPCPTRKSFTTAQQYQSLEQRRANLQSLATTAVDLSSARGVSASNELRLVLESYISKHSRLGDQQNVEQPRQPQVPFVANPLLKKNQTQVRRQPAAGPTTRTAARQSQQRKQEAKRKQNAARKERASGLSH